MMKLKNMMKKITYWCITVLTLSVTTTLLASCNSDNLKNEKNSMTTTTEKDLFKAIETNNLSAIKELIESKSINIEIKNSKGETPLMRAVYLKHNKIAFYLIEKGANVNTQDNILNSPFLYAGAEGNLEIVQKALQHGADFTVFNRYNGTALIPAAEKGHLEVVKLLVTTPNFPINHVNRLGWTALMEAIVLSNGDAVHIDIVKALIDGGVDVNIADFDGKTPLYHAKNRGYNEIIKLLETAGAHL